VKICPACSREYPSESTHCQDDGVALVVLRAENQGRPEELIGQVVDGRYRVEKIIGRGGMGVVYAVRHVVVGKPAAMKVLRIGDERAEGVLQRFIREAQTAAVVRSRHIVEMTDFGQLPNGFCYVVMELLQGMSLTQAMRENRLSRPDLLHVFGQMAESLDLVHAQGIVHRDLKPDNVFLVNESGDPLFVKLLDFGIAKAMHAQASGLTETGVILGTPYYMSPEQARGENVDHRTDIYALGVMMYRAFTGKLPFVAESMLGVLTRHLTEVPAPPSHITQIDGTTEHVILRCLEKDPNARFQTGGELAAALKAIASGRTSGSGRTQLMAAQPGGPRASYQGNYPAPSASFPPGVATPIPVQALDFQAPSGAYGAVGAPPTGGYAPAPTGGYAPAPTGSYAPGQVTPVPAQASYPPAMSSGLQAPPAGPMTGGHYAPTQAGYGNAHASVPPGAPANVTGGHYAPAQAGYGSPHGSIPPGMSVPSGIYSSPALGSGIHMPPSPAGSAPPGTPSAPELSGQQAVPELATQRGLATSSTGRIALPQKRSNALVVGLPLAVLAAGVMIAVAILVSRGDRAPEASAAAVGSSQVASSAQPAAAIPTPAAAPSSAAPVAEGAPSADASATPQAPGTEVAKTPRAPVYSKPAAPAKPSETTSKPAGKRPEIRSPFE
jgi:tRNA A-37 threonylcarbamoyl transferase component Bud32